RRSGGTGRRRGLKIPRGLPSCGFDSRLRHLIRKGPGPGPVLRGKHERPSEVPLMSCTFQFVAVPYETFAPLFDRTEDELRAIGVSRVVADEKPGFPCRVSLVDAEVGETVLHLTYTHHDVAGPDRASGPVYVRKGAVTARLP